MSVKPSENLLERLVPILLIASIGLAFVVGVLWQKVSNLEGGGAKVSGAQAEDVAGNVDANAAQPEAPTFGKLDKSKADQLPKVTESDHLRGNSKSKVFLVVYSDYECPFCERFHPTTNQVLSEYKDKVGVVFRHFPLEQIHPKARPAANASECVADLSGNEAFWKFTDEVFANQATSLADLAATAAKVGVNKSSFQSCLDAKKFDSKITDQMNGGTSAGVTGTPGSFIVNDKGDAWFIPGAYPYEQIKPLLDEALGA